MKYGYIARIASRRLVFKASDRDDFEQEAQIALRAAIIWHLPFRRGFKAYAWKRCEGAIRGALSWQYYQAHPSAVTKRHSTVLKAIRQHQALHGSRPSTSQLMIATGLPWNEVLESERFHHMRQREISLDEPFGDAGRTYGDFI